MLTSLEIYITNLLLFNILSIIYMNGNLIDYDRQPWQKTPYFIGHIFSLIIWISCSIIFLIKLCWYKNKELISQKNQLRLASLIRCMIILQVYLLIFGGVYNNLQKLHKVLNDAESEEQVE